MKQKVDYLIIGGGILGLSIARELRTRHLEAEILLIEKESELGQHASGRNSGVLHAGFYYSPDSLKARFTKEGNRALTRYCEDRNLSINKCGKLVVARHSADLVTLGELVRRGRDNGVELYEISEKEAQILEPCVKTYQRALFSPTTSSVNPSEVMKALTEDALKEGVQIKRDSAYIYHDNRDIYTTNGCFRADYIVNSSGLQADRIAKSFGFSKNYRILPFKGLYIYSDEFPGKLKHHIYPVPHLKNPFLGVHFTVTVDNHVKIGPTAFPAFWREQYTGFKNFSLKDLAEITSLQFSLLMQSNFAFRQLALEEITKQSKKKIVDLASELLEGVYYKNYLRWGPSGIRAQLVNMAERKLEQDFVLEGDKQSIHVLNGVSPGWTCALPFSTYVCDQIEKYRGQGK